VQVQIIEKQKQIELQQQEIMRKQRELEANVQKPADGRAVTGRDAGQRPEVSSSRPRPKAPPLRPRRPASPALTSPRPLVSPRPRPTGPRSGRSRGHRGAGPRHRRGDAQKAESFKEYNQAAVIQMLVEILPQVAGKISEPLAKTEKIVIINSGNGPGGGASKLTGDITQIVSQLPPVLEASLA